MKAGVDFFLIFLFVHGGLGDKPDSFLGGGVVKIDLIIFNFGKNIGEI